MELFNAYIPKDRQQALARGTALPDRTEGTALFADISGFTPLTESLARSLGPRRGVEELTLHLNSVYEGLVKEVHRFGGSVIAFAGDAITCWFDRDDGRRGLTSALALQAAMEPFGSLRLADGVTVALKVKVGLARGPARRFLVGNPEIQVIDVLAGHSLVRMAAATGLAGKGDVVAHAEGLGELLAEAEVQEWRPRELTEGRFAVVRGLPRPAPPSPWPEVKALPESVVRPWLLSMVYERLHSGQGEFLTELRPTVAVFVKFDGVDFDGDDAAGSRLNEYVCWVQGVLARHEGFLVDVSIGDKGCYLYMEFGAPLAHENDPWRALAAAIELRQPPESLGFVRNLRVGISRGTMRTGAYGGTERRTYGVLGDEVNVAARLMEHAAVGQVLVSERVRSAAGEGFSWEPLTPIKAKGKTYVIPVFGLLNRSLPFRPRGVAPGSETPLVGREEELRQLEARLDRAAAGRGQVVSLSAEAGMGKTRLVTEVMQRAAARGFAVYSGQCQSLGRSTGYLAWSPVWQQWFGVDPEGPVAVLLAAVRDQLAAMDPALLPRLPLLGAVLQVPIADNEVTRHFDPKLRKSSLEALLADCVRHRAADRPVLLVLEDCHLLDPLSADLLQVLARALAWWKVTLLVTSRTREARDVGRSFLARLPHATELELKDLPRAESGRLVALKMAARHGADTRPDPALLERLVDRAEGNPFCLEELLNFLYDQGIDPAQPGAADRLELPASMHGLILGRIDRLSENQKASLKVASVYGREFPDQVVCELQSHREGPAVRADLEELQRVDLTVLEQAEPECTYLFRHLVTHEVTYESLPFQTRARFHNEIGLFLERQGRGALGPDLDLLAFHFDRSLNDPKKLQYLLRAGEAAQQRYDNAAAISYYQRALPLLPQEERVPVLLKLGRVHELVGQWEESLSLYRQALTRAQAGGDQLGQARSQTAIAEVQRKRGAFGDATQCLESAWVLFQAAGDEAGVAEVLHASGTVAAQQGDYVRATALYTESLELRRKLNDQPRIASLFSNLGIVYWYQGDFSEARALYEASLSLRRQLGDQWSIANSLNNLGLLLRDQGDIEGARKLLEESLAINRQLGDRWSIANALSSLGDVALTQHDLVAAAAFLRESLSINRVLGDRGAMAFLFDFFGELAAAHGRLERSLKLAGAAAALRRSIGATLSPAEQGRLDRVLDAACAGLPAAEREACLEAGAGLSLEAAIDFALE